VLCGLDTAGHSVPFATSSAAAAATCGCVAATACCCLFGGAAACAWYPYTLMPCRLQELLHACTLQHWWRCIAAYVRPTSLCWALISRDRLLTDGQTMMLSCNCATAVTALSLATQSCNTESSHIQINLGNSEHESLSLYRQVAARYVRHMPCKNLCC
jgi:hypothetical protein